jgi:uncharacterized membrane protein
MTSSPIKPTWRTEIIPAALVIAAAGMSLYFYAHFPERVAMHWNIKGQVDGYSGRAVGAFAVPGMTAAMYLLLLGLPYLDPRRERYAEFAKVYHIFKALLLAVLVAIYAATGLFNLGYSVKIGLFVPFLIGLLFILMGNYMGKIKNNWFMGIRTPWTLSSENVWNKTHRFGGRAFMLFGLLLMVSPWLPEIAAMVAFVVGLLAVSIGTMAYSYLLFVREKKAKASVPDPNPPAS